MEWLSLFQHVLYGLAKLSRRNCVLNNRGMGLRDRKMSWAGVLTMWVTETGAMSTWQIILTICGKLLMFVMGWLLSGEPAH